jgi:hypothetical protein
MENGLLAEILAGEPYREREYVSPASTDTYDMYKACAMRTGKPVQRPRSFRNAARLRFTAVRSGIDAAPTNDLLDARTFTGRRLMSLAFSGQLRQLFEPFRTAFDSYRARTTWGVI